MKRLIEKGIKIDQETTQIYTEFSKEYKTKKPKNIALNTLKTAQEPQKQEEKPQIKFKR